MLSDNIRNYRKENNLSQDELAEKLGVSRQSISLWENGQTQPTVDNIIALAKIFNITADELLESYDGARTFQEAPIAPKKRNGVLIAVISVITAAAVIGAGSFLFLLKNRNAENKTTSKAQGNSSSQASAPAAVRAPAKTESKASAAASSAGKSTGNGSKPAASSPSSSKATAKTPAEKLDLFTYCKNFAIKVGTVNGDYCMYQQPATKYGGYENEYFSISYWGDSNMVEFCLHCPLDNTFSEDFYLRMRGGYNKKYEYLTSRYYRDNGESVRSATGYIDPAVFTDNYPLNCDKYDGSFDKQNDFMEESRVGMCDLIRCLKKFAEVENMECGFAAFDFVNFK